MATTLDKEGCEFGRLNRVKLCDMDKKLDNILENQKVLFNHQSDRIKPEQVNLLIAEKDKVKIRDQWITGIITAVVVFVLSAVIGRFI